MEIKNPITYDILVNALKDFRAETKPGFDTVVVQDGQAHCFNSSILNPMTNYGGIKIIDGDWKPEPKPELINGSLKGTEKYKDYFKWGRK